MVESIAEAAHLIVEFGQALYADTDHQARVVATDTFKGCREVAVCADLQMIRLRVEHLYDLSDLAEIVEVLNTKTDHLEISTNGYFTATLERICRDNPGLVIRISIEGLAELNDQVRGLRNGFDHALRSFLRLRRLGVENLGFAMTLSGENCRELLDVYGMCVAFD